MRDEGGKKNQQPKKTPNADAEDGDPEESTQSVTEHELLADFHLNFWLQTAEQFFAAVTVHCRQFGHEFVPRFLFLVATPSDTQSEERANGPNSDCRPRNHEDRGQGEKRRSSDGETFAAGAMRDRVRVRDFETAF